MTYIFIASIENLILKNPLPFIISNHHFFQWSAWFLIFPYFSSIFFSSPVFHPKSLHSKTSVKLCPGEGKKAVVWSWQPSLWVTNVTQIKYNKLKFNYGHIYRLNLNFRAFIKCSGTGNDIGTLSNVEACPALVPAPTSFYALSPKPLNLHTFQWQIHSCTFSNRITKVQLVLWFSLSNLSLMSQASEAASDFYCTLLLGHLLLDWGQDS